MSLEVKAMRNILDEKEDKCRDGDNMKTIEDVRKIEQIKQYKHGIKKDVNEEYYMKQT